MVQPGASAFESWFLVTIGVRGAASHSELLVHKFLTFHLVSIGVRGAAGHSELLVHKILTFHSYFSTRKEAQEYLKALLVDQQQNMLTTSGRMTVTVLLEKWLEASKPDWKTNTYRSYEGTVRLYLTPNIGKARIDRLTPLALEAMKTTLLKKHTPHIAAYTIRVLRMALKYAIRLMLLTRNVAEVVSAPKVEKREMQVWTPDEIVRFLGDIQLHRLHAMFYTAITTGMRRSELLGLKWSDLDSARQRLTVRHNLIDAKGGARLETPKTAASRRVVTISEDTVAQLEAHRTRQQVERKVCKHWQGHDAVFCTEAGTHLDPSNLSKMFRVLTLEAKVTPIRLHDLRHTAASLQIRQDSSPKEVADRLGHTDPGFTSRTYVHIYDDQRTAVAHSMDTLLSKAKRARN